MPPSKSPRTLCGSASIVRSASVVGALLLPLCAVAATPLGSVQFAPSPEAPVGWRGDGTGRYPGAAGPTVWERTAGAAGYTTKGIVWMAPLPNIGVGSPIVVGDRIFLTAEVDDLLCL